MLFCQRENTKLVEPFCHTAQLIQMIKHTQRNSNRKSRSLHLNLRFK